MLVGLPTYRSALRVALLATMVAIVAGCGCRRCVAPSDADAGGRELIIDGDFCRGLALSPLRPDIVVEGGGFGRTNVDTLRFAESAAEPAWQACQWWSRHDLGGAEMIVKGRERIFANEGKCVARRADGTLRLEINTGCEYSAPRKEGEQWPHLLIQQDFAQAPHLGQLAALRMAMQLRIISCENLTGSDFDESLHTAQAPFYLLLRNDNPSSPDYGQALWVGVPTFDYRYERLGDRPTVHWDEGTATYIYTIPPRKVWGDVSLHDRKRHSVDIDLLPFVMAAVDTMKVRGGFAASSADDIAVTGMNFGWEVPGTFIAALEVKGISLRAYPKAQARPVRVKMHTTMGDVSIELDDRTPRHRDNFAALVGEGYFDSLLFHRVIEGFMIQGGDPRTRRVASTEFDADAAETGEPRYWEDMEAEIRFPELYHCRGAVAAAREGDDVNPSRRSSRTQFYIVWGRTFDDKELDAQQTRTAKSLCREFVFPEAVREAYRNTGGTPHLDGQYTVFGRVVEGLDVVEAIQRTPTDSLDRPVEDVRILSAEIDD